MIRAVWGKAMSWVKRHPLALALGVGLILRLIGIQSRSVQYDDTFSIFLAARSLPEIVSGTAADTMPPLFYFLLHFWLMLGQQIGLIRLLSALLGLVVIWLTFRLVDRWLGREAAGWAAFLTAVSPLQIYHSQDVRMYMLLVVGQIAYAWFFTRIWFTSPEKPRLLDWIGLIIAGLAAVYSHNLAVFALIVPNLFLLLRRSWQLLGRLILAQMIIGLGALPWMVLLPGQLAKIQRAFWTPRPGPVEIIQAVIMFTASLPLPPILLAVAAVLSFQILILMVLELRRPGQQTPGVTFLAMLLLAPPVLLFIVSYLMRPVFVPRGFLVSSLAYYGLAGFVIARSWSRPPGKLVAGAFILAAILTLPSFYTFNAFPRSPYQAAARYLQAAVQPGAMIVHDTKLSYFPMHFYAPQLAQTFIADAPGSANDTYAPASQQAMQLIPQSDLPTAAGDHTSLYFVTFSQVFDEYEAMGQAGHPAIRWLDGHYRLAERQVFGDLEIYHYTR